MNFLVREALIHIRIKEILTIPQISEFTNSNLYVLWYILKGIQWEVAFTHKRLMGNIIAQSVYKSTDMDMRVFWLFFLEIPITLVENIYGCQSGNMENHLLFTCDMLKYRMACCNHHYGKTMPDYWSAKASLPTDQLKFFPDNFMQSLIGLPFLPQPADWIYSELRVKIKTRLAKSSRYQKTAFV